MERPLVVGVDGSDSSLHALDWATDEAVRHRLPLRVIHASLWERYEGVRPSFATDRPSEQVMAEHIAAASAERARSRAPQVRVSADILPEDPVSALLHAGHTAFALVTGARGRGGIAGLLLGSVGLSVAARAVCPVVVVRGSEQNRRGEARGQLPGGVRGRVVLGVGDPDEDSAAVRFAFREAEVRGCALDAVRAWRHPADHRPGEPLIVDESGQAHEEAASAALTEALRAAEAAHRQVELRRHVIEGPAHKVLLDASAGADLLVVGARRRHGHLGLQLGRVDNVLLHHADCPVAVVAQRT